MEQGGLFLVLGFWVTVWFIMVYFMEELTQRTYNDL